MPETYIERVLQVVEKAVLEAGLDWNPCRSDAEGDNAVILVDASTGHLHLLSIEDMDA